jgi:hypothetical protein
MTWTSSLISSKIHWLLVATQYSNVVDGILLYNFAAECWSCCHMNLGENGAPRCSVRFIWLKSPWYSTPYGSERQRRESSPPTTPSAVIRAADVVIRAQGGWIASRGERSSPPVSWTPLRLAAVPLSFLTAPGIRISPPLCRCHCPPRVSSYLPHHRDSLLLPVDRRSNWHGAGHPAATPVLFFFLWPPRVSLDSPATACECYKLSPRLASQHHHAPPHPVLLPIVHQSALISNFPQNCFPPPQRVPHRGQRNSSQLTPSAPSIEYSQVPVMLLNLSNCIIPPWITWNMRFL